MKNYRSILSALALAVILTTACGTAETEQRVGGSPQAEKEVGGETEQVTEKENIINEEVIAADLTYSNGVYTFTLKNLTDEEVDLTFSSSQEYEYQIKSADGEHLYTYSMDKMFMQAIVEQKLAANETYSTEVDVTIFSTLEPGAYQLEIWSMAQDSELKAEIEFTLEETGNNLTGVYVGEIDGQSVEIVDEEENTAAYRLTTTVKEAVSMLEENETVSYSYYKQDDQLILTMIFNAE